MLWLFAILAPHLYAQPDNIAWRSLQEVQKSLAATNCYWNGHYLSFSNHNHHLRFFTGRKKAEINGTLVWMNVPNRHTAQTSDWQLAGIDLDCLTVALLPHSEGEQRAIRVLLDAGHGGEDAGAVNPTATIKEKDITLALALELGQQLQKQGLHVDYTRTNDCALTLSQRTRLATQKKADIFVSIHINHASNTNATGIETYILPPAGFAGTAQNTAARGWQIGNRHDYHNALLGFSIHQALTEPLEVMDRGLKRAGYFVLRETACPAVLLELGFLSNPAESVSMTNALWQSTHSAKIAQGIISYAKKLTALETAVTQKRQQEAEANERWRQHLARQEAKAATPIEPPVVTQVTATTSCVEEEVAVTAPMAPQTPPAPPLEPPPAAPIVVEPPAPVIPGTNTIFDFYLHANQQPELK